MPTPIDPVQIREVMRALGVLPSDMEALQRLPLEAARQCLAELKERVRKNYKTLAFELHPDRTGNDPVKTERFKLIGSIKDEFEKLQIQPRPQPQIFIQRPMTQMQVTRVVTWTSAGRTYAATTTANSVTIGVPFRVATMKPT